MMDEAMREALRAYAERSWDLLAARKREFVAERYRTLGPAASLAAARRLRERWRRLHPNAPTPDMREADFAAHLALKEKMERASHVFRR